MTNRELEDHHLSITGDPSIDPPLPPLRVHERPHIPVISPLLWNVVNEQKGAQRKVFARIALIQSIGGQDVIQFNNNLLRFLPRDIKVKIQ